ncbi:U6 snRNA-associated Sm-like protein LSm4 isoform X2 [Choloepus didactylus]|uniref:U6 snRNA-associated Sm-like protein LSm4 isoform X2 n=1 Tax=Choloepus didactylus TaxID=27675 RepID=UPI00189CAAE7|nr:U6 snRNA-associated Sm-like protein LSm4 isoform X2 [Choloepus didactylus]
MRVRPSRGGFSASPWVAFSLVMMSGYQQLHLVPGLVVPPISHWICSFWTCPLVELKNGETYNGHLVSCDNWMNINLREVICTSRDGDKFWRMPECYVRGSTIKYLRIPDEVIDMVKEEAVARGRGRGGLPQQKQQRGRGTGGVGRGVFGGRGRGGVPGGGRGQPEKKPGRQAGKQ